ncbi:MAG: FAD-linked oxidase C-terminal domain-containing protein [Chloroflexales bacterium]
MTNIPEIIAVQPGARMVTAPAETTIEQLNRTLAEYGLWLPVSPLTPGLRLSGLVAHNAGGRHRLRYGPIGRYLRAAVFEGVHVGGPTIKRATGLGLHRAIAGGAVDLGCLHELTLSVCPLPVARVCLTLRCTDLESTCRLADALLHRGLALSALALAEAGDGAGLLLAELEGGHAVVERQIAALATVARSTGAVAERTDGDGAWGRWEDLAVAQIAAAHAIELTLPRAALPAFIDAARVVARRHGLVPTIWGDAGVGALYLRLDGSPVTGQRCVVELTGLAHAVGGDLSTELGRGMRTQFPNTNTAAGAAKAQFSPYQPQLFDALRAIVGPRYVLTRPEELGTYTLDASIAQPEGLPLAVVLPASTAELSALMQIAAEYGLPVVSRGNGSGLAGGSVPCPGSLLISLNRMDQIVIDREQMVARVGAGAITAQVQRAAEVLGLFYPPDPSSQSVSTIGGNIACNAGGPRCVKYGVTADYVLSLTAVLADGSLVRWGDGLAGQGPESGLAQLLVGSEGTLAVIAEASLRLVPRPAAQRTILAIFQSLDAACATVEQIMASGVMPAALELMDDTTISAVEAYLSIGLPRDAGAILLMLADGEPEAVETDSLALADLAWRGAAVNVQVAGSPADEVNLWRGRRAIAPALARIRASRLGEDISVPLPQIAACVRGIKQVSAEYRLPIVVFGHAGDGNLHPNILFDPRDPGEVARLWPCAEAIFAVALDLGGTLSGEHGIGILKRPFLHRAVGAGAIRIQSQIKHWLDPQGRLNPGKLFPDVS